MDFGALVAFVPVREEHASERKTFRVHKKGSGVGDRNL